MTKARSRLAPHPAAADPVVDVQPHPPAPEGRSHPALQSKHRRHLPALMMAMVMLGLLVAMTIFFSPDQVRNWLVPNAYLPFFGLLFLFSFFLASFIFLNSKIGLVAAILICSLVFFRIQHLTF